MSDTRNVIKALRAYIPTPEGGLVARNEVLLAVAEHEPTWHPIADAPKDGTEIRCWCPDIGERVLYWDDGWCLAGARCECDYEPTHWRPVSRGPTP